jgi:hypothetical protein
LWALGLSDVGPAELRRGIERCAVGLVGKDGWPPTLPEFREACKGVPSLADIRAEFLGKRERSRFGVAVWARIDSFSFARADTRAAERMLAEAYNATRADVLAGEVLPELPEILPAPVEVVKVKTDAAAREALRNIAEAVGA